MRFLLGLITVIFAVSASPELIAKITNEHIFLYGLFLMLISLGKE